MSLLEARGVTKRFGGIAAVDNVDLTLESDSVHGLIGPNGSGKTTLLSVLAGTFRADAGEVRLRGRGYRPRSAHRAVAAGVARTFQTTRLLHDWTLGENLAAAAAERSRGHTAPGVAEVLRTIGLADQQHRACNLLSNSEQRIAMIGVALATGPTVLLLDEPAVGMSPEETQRLDGVVRSACADHGVSILVVEHNMHFLMSLAQRVTVMSAGRVLAEGTPAEVRANPEVVATYLGG